MARGPNESQDSGYDGCRGPGLEKLGLCSHVVASRARTDAEAEADERLREPKFCESGSDKVSQSERREQE